VKAYIDRHRDDYGVEPICRVLQMAPSCYWRHAARQRNPQLRSERAQRDEGLKADIQRVWHANWQVYGADKVWLQMNREGIRVARCTVERLMRAMGLQGARRGKTVRTTTPDTSVPCPLDHVNRHFHASRPNELWVSDFTYVSTWQGWLYVAFVVDVYARRIVGWRVSRSMHTDFVLDVLEQALYDRQPAAHALTHHSDRGSQYVSIRYTERLDQAGIQPSVGSRGDSYDNALAVHAAEFGAPLVESGIRDAVFAAQLDSRQTGFGFFEDGDDLFFAKTGLAHAGSLAVMLTNSWYT